MSVNILTVRNLKKYYPTVKAVDDISFDIEKGTVYTLLGPNGAGKTTTLEIIEGIKKADDGRIIFYQDVYRQDTALKNHLFGKDFKPD